MTKVTIEVIAADIRYGRRASPEWCPIAVATNRLLKPQFRAAVDTLWLEIFLLNVPKVSLVSKAYRELPEQAREFVKKFDRGKVVEPFSFELDIPEECLR